MSTAAYPEPFVVRRLDATSTDDELMAAVDTGQVETALSLLQARYESQVFRFVNGIVRDAHLAQDVAQETFAKIFFKSHLYHLGTNFKAWVYEIARNQALSALRTRRRHPRPITSLAGPDGDSARDLIGQIACDASDRPAETAELMDEFRRAVALLPESYRRVFTECVIGGRAYQAVADEFGLPTGTVAIRIMRARKRLFQSLGHHVDRLRRPPACIQ
jgi:RNA polymerase sigma-70 factor (ECF subfamily)